MNRIAEMDARARRVMSNAKGEPCTWVPKAKRPPSGDEYTMDQARSDDSSRPRMPGLVAIVTWRNAVGDAATGGDSRLASSQVLVDLPLDAFPNGIPIKGDQFELPDQDPGEQLVEVARSNHDGSARLFYWCKVIVP